MTGVLALIGMTGLFLKRKNLKYGIALLILTMPFFRVLQWLMGWSAISKFWFNLIFISMIVALYFKLSVDHQYRVKVQLNKLDVAVMLAMLHGCVLMYITYESYGLFEAFNGYRAMFFGGVIYFVYRGCCTTAEDVRDIVQLLVLSTVIIGVEVVIEFTVMNILQMGPLVIPWLNSDLVGTFVDNPNRVRIGGVIFRPLGLLTYVHYTSYVIAIGVLILAPFFLSPCRRSKQKIFTPLLFYILLCCLILSTTRSIIFIIILLLLFMAYKYNVLGKKMMGIAGILLMIFLVALYAGILDYVAVAFSSEDGFYKAFKDDPLKSIAGTNPVELIFGRGTGTSKYGEIMFDSYLEENQGFQFKHISDEIHFFSYMDRTGLIGGILFIFQTLTAYSMGIRASRKTVSPVDKRVLIGLSFCPLLLLFSSIHILHADAVMQFYSYSVLGILGASSQVLRNQAKLVCDGNVA